MAHRNEDLLANVLKIFDKDVEGYGGITDLWRNYSEYLKFNVLFCVMPYVVRCDYNVLNL